MDAASSSAKRCVVCGADVSQARRTKTAAGEYYCEACYAALPRPGKGAAAERGSPAAGIPMVARGIERRIYVALGLALALLVGVAVVAYLFMAGPSRRQVVVAPPRVDLKSAAAPAAPRSTLDVNAVSSHGRTKLNLAAAGGHVDTATDLLARGADVNAKDDDGTTALGAACRRGQRAMVEF